MYPTVPRIFGVSVSLKTRACCGPPSNSNPTICDFPWCSSNDGADRKRGVNLAGIAAILITWPIPGCRAPVWWWWPHARMIRNDVMALTSFLGGSNRPCDSYNLKSHRRCNNMSRTNFAGYEGHATMFSRMSTITCCLVHGRHQDFWVRGAARGQGGGHKGQKKIVCYRTFNGGKLDRK